MSKSIGENLFQQLLCILCGTVGVWLVVRGMHIPNLDFWDLLETGIGLTVILDIVEVNKR